MLREKKNYKKYLKKNNRFPKVLRILIFMLLAYAAIRIGLAGGNSLSGFDTEFIGKIDVEHFKSTMNMTLPIIDTTYNSGNISVSLSNEIKSLINTIFEFDLGSPLTILNAQSPIFYSYFSNDYQDYLAREERSVDDDSRSENDDNQGQDDGSAGKDGKPDYSDPEESSIYYEENEDDKKDNNAVADIPIVLRNETNFKIDVEGLLKEPLKLGISGKGPQILIYHTHTSEGYTIPASKDGRSVPSWTREGNSVVKVGEELTEYLKKRYGFNVMHNAYVNDSDYNSSYTTGLSTVTKILKGNPSIKIVFDIHRDGLSQNQKLRLAKTINGKAAAQIMFVVGSSAKFTHPNWKENLKFALKLEEKLNQQCPGLARPVNIDENRFNQHVRNSALIIEIGGDGNTVEECLESTKYLAKAINDVIRDIKQ